MPAWVFTLYRWFLTSWMLKHSSSLKLRYLTEIIYVKYSVSFFLSFSFLSTSILFLFYFENFFLHHWTSLTFAGSVWGDTKYLSIFVHLCFSYYGTYLFSRACFIFKHDIPILAEQMAIQLQITFSVSLWLNGACDQIYANFVMWGVPWGHLLRRLSLEFLHSSHKVIRGLGGSFCHRKETVL